MALFKKASTLQQSSSFEHHQQSPSNRTAAAQEGAFRANLANMLSGQNVPTKPAQMNTLPPIQMIAAGMSGKTTAPNTIISAAAGGASVMPNTL